MISNPSGSLQIEDFTESVDLAPTILEYLNIDVP